MRCSGSVVALAACALVVALAVAGYGQVETERVYAPSMQGMYRPFSARAWGMGGASTALAQEADGLLANPAGLAFTDGQQALAAWAKAELEASLWMYDPDLGGVVDRAEDSLSQWGLAYSSAEEKPGGDIAAWGLTFANAEDWNDFAFAFAGRRGAESRLGYGLSFDRPDTGGLYFGLGLLYRTPEGFSIGVNWDDIFAMVSAGGPYYYGGFPMVHAEEAQDVVTLGVAYEKDNVTLAVDLFGISGDLLPEQETLMGAEFRLEEGLALRLGSAEGNLTYGLGYSKDEWSVDYAHVSTEEKEEIPGLISLGLDTTIDVISVSYRSP